MADVTQLLCAIEQGDPHAAGRLLPLVYDELRRLAAQRLARESAGQTLEPTALVHEAYLRLVGRDADQPWDTRGHFFAAAAKAMRRILVENARRKKRVRHGGQRQRVELDEGDLASVPPSDRLLALDEALTRFAAVDAAAAQVVQLHFFGGMTLAEVAQALGFSTATVKRRWAYARAWLRCAIDEGDGSGTP
jgi:RNA polymerase sigma factor (TIGR02999 family)